MFLLSPPSPFPPFDSSYIVFIQGGDLLVFSLQTRGTVPRDTIFETNPLLPPQESLNHPHSHFSGGVPNNAPPLSRPFGGTLFPGIAWISQLLPLGFLNSFKAEGVPRFSPLGSFLYQIHQTSFAPGPFSFFLVRKCIGF